MKKEFSWLLLIGLVSVACSQSGSTGTNDMATTNDQSAGTEDLATPVIPPPTATLSLIAGAPGGSGNLDGIGAAARLYNPPGVAWDGAGNLYVADAGNNTIRKVVVATGAVTTLAGTAGQGGFRDGTGPAARFSVPYGVAWDGAGNLYVTDASNHAIRKVVVATGAVTTLAGSAGTSGSSDGSGATARFNYPRGMVWDGAGSLYVTDSSNHTIRKVAVATGAVTTLAGSAGTSGSADGTGSLAQFSVPKGVTWDGAGNLYIADTGNQTVRKVVAATGAVTTLAGSAGMSGSTDGIGALARFSNPSGVAVDGVGNLYVADAANSTLRKVVVATGAVLTVAGSAGFTGGADGTGTAARFYSLSGLALDGTGNLYVADLLNNTIRKVVVASAAVTTLAGLASGYGTIDGTGATARFYGPAGVANDGAGNLYIADVADYTIRKVVVATAAVTTLAGTAGRPSGTDGTGAGAGFNGPTGVTLDGAGNLYVADSSNNTIRKVVVATGDVTTLAGMAGLSGSTDATGSAARFNNPSGVVLDAAGNLYVSDSSSNTIRKVVVATRAVTTLAGTAGSFGTTDALGAAARFNRPAGVALDGAGNLYVADSSNHTIRKVAVATGAVTTLAGAGGLYGSADGPGATARFNGPIGVATDGAGSLYVADMGNGTIRRVQLTNGSVTTLVGVAGQKGVKLGQPPAGLNQPRALTALATGEVIILDENVVLSAR